MSEKAEYKVYIFERTNVFKLRLDKLLHKLSFKEILYYQERIISVENFLKHTTGEDLIIVDMDQFDDLLFKIENYINSYLKERFPTIIVITGSIESRELLSLYGRGISDVIIKPFSDEIFISKILRQHFNRFNNTGKKMAISQSKRCNMLTWCSDYQIGIETIDNEHKDIIEHFERLYELMKDGHGQEYYVELIRFLENYVNHHFDNEERLQRQIQYDQIEEHMRIHNEFRTEVQNLINQHEAGPISNLDLIKINLFIKDWLVKHIMIEDKKIGAFMNKSI